jgi:hypothetical protein
MLLKYKLAFEKREPHPLKEHCSVIANADILNWGPLNNEMIIQMYFKPFYVPKILQFYL